MAWSKIDQYPKLLLWLEKKLKDENYSYTNIQELQTTLKSYATGKGARGFNSFLDGSDMPNNLFIQRYGKQKTWKGLFTEERNHLSELAEFSSGLNQIERAKDVDSFDEIHNRLMELANEQGDTLLDKSEEEALTSRLSDLRDKIELSQIESMPNIVPPDQQVSDYVIEGLPFITKRTTREITVPAITQESLVNRYGPDWRRLLDSQRLKVATSIIDDLRKKGKTEELKQWEALPYV